MPTFEAASPAGESTTEFLLYSEEGGGGFGTSTSTAEEEAFSSPVVYREDISNSQREQLLYDETNGSVNRVRLTSSGEELHSLRRTLRRSFSQRRPSHLNGLNYLNVVTYAAHLFVSYGIGIWGLNHILETRWEIIMKYETLVTPAHWAYYLWAPIVIMEGFFSLAQLLPHYRARSLIQDGTSFYFFYTFVIQTAWTFFFSFQLFILSFISVVGALLSLLSLLASQHKSLLSERRRNLVEYTLFRCPFYLHTGWMALMTLDHMCLLVRRYAPEHVGMQVAADILALAFMFAVAIVPLTLSTPVCWPQQDFIIPLVVIWSYIGIAWHLEEPSETMIDIYGEVIIHAVKYGSYFLAAASSCCLVPCVVVWLAREFCTIRIVELDD
ncbi:hypothetical protein FisN_8Hh347 [Fistulifera solaris]|uniref:Transmembrane protein n=1 Tax=Fistulifera solaris TaxID=1519565 RepID=A0A1Z5KHG1_FISSO|nr:hypothetical protein FisN_8Hh347 [Fistulifera solaris]|eukprot:GAX25753.1 hypothetical protein FisN_8Hh347 [Fistulifera solaris]